MVELQKTLAQSRQTLQSFQNVADKADGVLGNEGNSLAVQLRQTLGSAQSAMDQLNKTMQTVQPALSQVSTSTIPSAEAAIRDLRATTRALRNVTEKIDEQGAGALLKGQKLPDYKK
jgi:phospholipid/cholesterol/gamma-HCH transport system substrate-binding protein